jgi:geranyl-CoA carboxylase beta subunit|tara:strand:- start:585 stop:2207 length:1623 start_codon:yes stop_codon:yes gene_type:complete
MSIFNSKVDSESSQFIQNRDDMLNLIEKRKDILDRSRKKSDEKKSRFQERGQLSPRERLNALIDPDSEFLDLYSMANYLVQDPDPDTSIPGANMIAGIGFVNGIRCMILVDDSGISAGAATDKTIGKALGCIDIAMKQKLPFVHLVESAGINLLNYTVEFWANFGAVFYGKARLSAAGIPTIAVLHGMSTAGGAYHTGMSDYVVGVKNNGMAALAGSALLKAATGEDSSNEELGGAEMHSVITGLVEYLANDDLEAINITRDLVNKLNWQDSGKEDKSIKFKDPKYNIDEVPGIVPIDYKRGYDIREVIARIVDGSEFLELKPRFGITMVCVQAEIEGQRCGILANNGPIDNQGANKAAQFIQLCDQIDIPLIFLNNVTGYMVGKKYEQAGMIKHGSKMIQAVSNAKVPKISIFMGASFGAANYGMCGYGYNPDFLFSWPNAKIGVMGGRQAASTMRQVIEGSAKRKNEELDQQKLEDKEKQMIEHYDKQSDIFYVSGCLLDQGIIDPRDTRKVLSFSLKTFSEAKDRILKPNSFGIARM